MSARGGPIRRYPALATGLGLLVVSALLVLWARTRPGFDPYGWLVWGHQTVIGALDTNAAPSWKPLPYLFTVPLALTGHYQPILWTIVSAAVSLSGVIFAARIAYRLTGPAPGRRYAPVLAALFAGVALLGLRDYSHYILSAQSDPMVVALCLGAIDCHLSERPGWAFALGTLASLGRPEVWPFLGLYSIWVWWKIRSLRWLIAGGIALIVLLWFGVPALTSRSAFVAATNAMGSGRRLHSDRVLGTFDRFLDLHETPLELLALLSVGLALMRRDRVTVVLALGALMWVAIEIALALRGLPGLPRYMFEAAAVMIVVAAAGIGRILADPPWAANAWRRGSSPRAPVPRPRAPRSSVSAWAAVALVVVIAGSLVPAAVSRARVERKDLHVQRLRTTEIGRLAQVVSRVGGAARLRGCGEPLTRLEYQTLLAWQLRVNVATVGFKYGPAIHSTRPIVLFTPGRHGWRVQALHQRRRECRRLPR
ncbi:MAG: hypothetical protein ACR2OB_08155 [Solirubrobacteraceae bacterium]